MSVYVNTKFDGFYPVGTSAIVIADDKKEAKDILNKELIRHGLKPSSIESQFEKVKTRTKGAIILNDGDY